MLSYIWICSFACKMNYCVALRITRSRELLPKGFSLRLGISLGLRIREGEGKLTTSSPENDVRKRTHLLNSHCAGCAAVRLCAFHVLHNSWERLYCTQANTRAAVRPKKILRTGVPKNRHRRRQEREWEWRSEHFYIRTDYILNQTRCVRPCKHANEISAPRYE